MNTPLRSLSTRVYRLRSHAAGSKRQWGAEVVEIALTMTYFLLLVFAFMEGVRLIYHITILDYLARDAVRYVVVRGHRAAADNDADPSTPDNGAPATKASVTSYIQNQDILGLITVNACWTANGACEDAGLVHDNTNPANIIYNNSAGQPFSVTVSHRVFSLFSDVLWLDPAGIYSRTAEAKILY